MAGNLIRLGPASQMCLKILEDGEWRPQSEVIEEAKMIVAPGVALRANERARSSASKHGGRAAPPVRQKNFDKSQLVAAGQRLKASEALNSLILNGRIERRVIDGVKMVRMIKAYSRVLVVKDGTEITVGNTSDVIVTIIDSKTINDHTIEELEDLRYQVQALPNRFEGRLTAMTMIEVALVLKKSETNEQ